MSELSPSLRSQLGRVIVEARSVAEAGAKRALESLAVGRHEPHGSMSLEERDLRVRLRAHGRQLGDVRDRQRGGQSISRLMHEVAYEHWHRMLFARFLAENGLLIHPEHEVAMSVRDIEELALETSQDPHQLAADFAQTSLPQIFRTGDPVLEVTLAPETRQALEALLDSLPTDVFTADDSLGWTYQYWQSEKKDAVNASGEKIGADELPAVTQLFTEHYMVMFLYHNTIGSWHAGKVLSDDPHLAESAQTEAELRQAVALKTDAGDSYWDYLRFVRDSNDGDENDNPTGPWRPAAGSFEGWPKSAKELKVLDPCCGSGHFLVTGFKLLARLRMYEEGLVLEDAIKAVLQNNLFGLELDPRCTQIAAFNVALAAWRWVGKPIDLPELNIACSGLSIGSSKKDWLALASDDERLEAGLGSLYELFRQAPELGSLIDPKSLGDDMFVANYEELQPLLQEALVKESANEETIERAVAAQGMAKAAELLAGEYTLVVTNVPYLARGKQNNSIQVYAQQHFPRSKADLATVMLERTINLASPGGTISMVTPQNWLFLKSYSKLRKALLQEASLDFVVRLGANAFRDMNFWAATTALVVLSNSLPAASNCFAGLDTSESKKRRIKRSTLEGSDTKSISVMKQRAQIANPDHRILLQSMGEGLPLSSIADIGAGTQTGDSPRALRAFWELPELTKDHRKWLTTSRTGAFWGGRSYVTSNSLDSPLFKDQPGAVIRGRNVWGKLGVALQLMNELPHFAFDGELFDNNCGVIAPHDLEMLPAIVCWCESMEHLRAIRLIDQKVSVTPATIGKVPFDTQKWREAGVAKYPNGLPEPSSNDPTQWLFHGHPANAASVAILQVAVSRLLGYRWPPELDSEMRLSDNAREWVSRCADLEDLADDDGVVCLPAIRSELRAVDRLRSLVATALGSEWSAAKERELLAAAAGESGKPVASLDVWLRDKFFEEHCKLFLHRPFIWHIWDGNRDGFHCLVNAHRLTGPDGEGRRTLEAITYSYLGDWIQRQKDDQRVMVEGADARLAAAQHLQRQLVNILNGEPPYDIFVRWKPLHEQAVGWEPDTNNGARLNIRPFMSADLRKGGKKGAGILRWKPNIKWKKDRGKDPESLRPIEDFPWLWGCNGDGSMSDRTDYTTERAGKAKFDGNRWNNLHYSRAVKEAARAAAKG